MPKPKWEFPRLCRGGSKSLTYPAVGSLGRIDETPNRELPSTRKEISSTDDHESLSRNGSKVQLYKMVRATKRRSQKLTRIVSAHTGEAFLRVEGSRAEATGTSRFERLQN